MDAKSLVQMLILSFLNKPYIWGGKNPIVGMDCSGLVCELLQSLGMLKSNDEHNAQSLYDFFQPKSGKDSVPIFGSLLFYGEDLTKITHVAFGLNELQMIEAGGGTSVNITPQIAEKTNAYVKIRPFDHRSDLAGILNPKYSWG